ncbi:hypothetical protein ACFU6R_07340 [Streptomyces sp. NPDC057499]|uniref:hypothetical protein n=1 Tax=Streptomyces sp. NPDC057499 TaxID=3346150 RepID=UPI00368F7388
MWIELHPLVLDALGQPAAGRRTGRPERYCGPQRLLPPAPPAAQLPQIVRHQPLNKLRYGQQPGHPPEIDQGPEPALSLTARTGFVTYAADATRT